MSKPGKSLKALCKRLGVRLTVKRGKKRVYKSVKVLKEQCKRKKKKKKRRRKRRFGTSGTDLNTTDLTLSWDSLGNYYGQHLDGKKHGLGALMYNNGSTYKGEWKDNKKHGEGRMKYNDGSVYEGMWKNDKKNGQGKEIYSDGTEYVGEWKDGCWNGQGKFTIPNGALIGKWENFLLYKGKFIFNNGDVYEGEFEGDNQYPKGKGKLTFANGDTYEGEFKNGFQDGYGKFTYASGSVYEGGFKKDEKNGYGKITFVSGSVYEGGWKDDNKHGQGKYTWTDGTVYEGEYKDDKKHGQGKYTWSDGRVYKGGWKDGNKHGQGVYYDYFYNNKIIKKGYWEYDIFKTGDLYKFKKDDDDESLNIFQHVKRKIDGDVLKSNEFGKDAPNEFKKVLKSFMKEGFGKRRKKVKRKSTRKKPVKKRKVKKRKVKKRKVKRRRKFGSNPLEKYKKRIDELNLEYKYKNKVEKILQAAKIRNSGSSENLNNDFITKLESKDSEEQKELINNEYFFYSTLTRGKIKGDWDKYQKLFPKKNSNYTPEQVKKATKIVKEFNDFVKELESATCMEDINEIKKNKNYKKIINEYLKVGSKWEDIKRIIQTAKEQYSTYLNSKKLHEVKIDIDNACTNTEASRCIKKIDYNIKGPDTKYSLKGLELKKLQEELGKEKDNSKKNELEKQIKKKQEEMNELKEKQEKARITNECMIFGKKRKRKNIKRKRKKKKVKKRRKRKK